MHGRTGTPSTERIHLRSDVDLARIPKELILNETLTPAEECFSLNGGLELPERWINAGGQLARQPTFTCIL